VAIYIIKPILFFIAMKVCLGHKTQTNEGGALRHLHL
jgi:hypothetical protein